MRILILNYEFPPLGGGASPVSYEIAKRYVGLGHQVDVVTMHYGGLPFHEIVDGIDVFRVKCFRSKKEMCHLHEMLSYVVSAWFFLRKHLKKNKYDANHTHFLIPTGVLSLWVKWKFGLKYIITAHGSDVPGYNEDRFTFSHRFTKPILGKIIANSEKIVSPSSFLRDLILKNFGDIFNDKICKIPNGIDSSIFTPNQKDKIILTTGRLLPRKGVQYLVKAVSDRDIGYTVHICGDGPMRAELENLAKQSKTKIIFHGWLDSKSEAYRALLSKASIYVLVSSKENASVALLEAMSSGCGVITSNVSGCPETVDDSGIIIPPEVAKALNEALMTYINNPKLLDDKMKAARQRVVDMYDWQFLTQCYLDLLISLK